MIDEKDAALLADAGFEDGCVSAALGWSRGYKEKVGPDAFALMSIAISLKRIADTLATLPTEPCNIYGETILPAFTRAISDGIAGR